MPAQTHVESESFGVGARIDDRDGRVGLLRRGEQPIRRSPRGEVLRRLEVARPDLISPAIFEDQLQQRIGLREIGEIRDAGPHLQRAGRLRIRDYAPLANLVRVQVPVGREVQTKGVVDRDQRCAESRMTCERGAIVMHRLQSEEQAKRRRKPFPDRRRRAMRARREEIELAAPSSEESASSKRLRADSKRADSSSSMSSGSASSADSNASATSTVACVLRISVIDIVDLNPFFQYFLSHSRLRRDRNHRGPDRRR